MKRRSLVSPFRSRVDSDSDMARMLLTGMNEQTRDSNATSVAVAVAVAVA
eukprot:CAMPEP_0172397532 /NCGR_PEP_ID=MMETSP1061-20121228/31073_1 /TAXON_ID=37318 /ORGANISM="Pseudo-nitzschia pungens, Strain cf. pungens" /LENGTH=49 /DNA_ID= /DNA_START= /DNA_END= /DNA_ORIENTATION=